MSEPVLVRWRGGYVALLADAHGISRVVADGDTFLVNADEVERRPDFELVSPLPDQSAAAEQLSESVVFEDEPAL